MDGIADHRLAGDHDLVADLQVADNADVAAEQAIAADLGAAGDAGATGDGRMRTDLHVVRDLHQVVQAYVFVQHGVFQRATVDAGVGADFAIVADAHAAELRHLDPLAGVHRQAKAVGAEHGTGMHAHALAQPDPGDQGDPGDQLTAGIQAAVLADHAAGADDAVLADHAARTDRDERTDVRAGRNLGTGVDHRAGVDARRTGRRDVEQRGDLGEGGVRVLGDERGAGSGLGVFGTQHHQRGLAVGQLGAVARVGKEGQLARTGMGEGGHAMDGGGGVAMDLQAELLGELLGGVGGSIHGGSLTCDAIAVMRGGAGLGACRVRWEAAGGPGQDTQKPLHGARWRLARVRCPAHTARPGLGVLPNPPEACLGPMAPTVLVSPLRHHQMISRERGK